MIPIYNIEDFYSTKTIEGKFTVETYRELSFSKNLKPPHKYNFHQLIWLTGGLSSHVIDDYEIDIQSGTLLIISPGQVHSLNSYTNMMGYSISFTEQFLHVNHTQESIMELTFLDDSYAKPYLCLDEDGEKEIKAIIDIILEELIKEPKIPVNINYLLFVLLSRIQRLLNKTKPVTLDSYHIISTKKFRKLVETHYKKEKNLSFYANLLHISPHYLNKLVRAVTGKTAGSVIRDRRLIEAKRMLLYCNLPIGDISYILGFKDFSYFSRQFKILEGVTPAEYRKRKYDKYEDV